MARRGGRLVLLVLMLAVVNLPLVHSAWTSWRVKQNGVEVTGEVTGTVEAAGASDPVYVVEFTLPEDVDPDQRGWSARVNKATYDEARETSEVRVRAVPGDPAAQRVTGQVASRVGLVVTLVADAILLGLLLLLWRAPWVW